ncbi:MAG: Na+/H+ antiporter subunit E [Candidatus Sumerlaeia bacterium]|nr:Na+/H+ antiporter subunit E [Candidatus Sumerlaeia bacterium]
MTKRPFTFTELLVAMAVCAVFAKVVFGNFTIATYTATLLFAFTFRFFDRIKNLVHSPRSLLRFLWDFSYDMVKSNLVLAYDVLTPKAHYDVHFVAVPIGDLTPAEIAFLSHRITLTPGTLTVDIAEDRQKLVIHTMYPDLSALEAQGLALRKPLDILKGRA